MIELFGLGAKTNSYLKDNNDQDKKKSKRHKKVCHKKDLKLKQNKL